MKINGEKKYARIIIKPIFKIEELTGEVIDEETKTIHKCHPLYTQSIADKIMQDKIVAMKEKNYIFSECELENLRFICNCLYHQKQDEMAEEIEEQYLEKKLLTPMSYDEILAKYLPIITDETKETIKRRWKPIYKMRGEQLPSIAI